MQIIKIETFIKKATPEDPVFVIFYGFQMNYFDKVYIKDNESYFWVDSISSDGWINVNKLWDIFDSWS